MYSSVHCNQSFDRSKKQARIEQQSLQRNRGEVSDLHDIVWRKVTPPNFEAGTRANP